MVFSLCALPVLVFATPAQRQEASAGGVPGDLSGGDGLLDDHQRPGARPRWAQLAHQGRSQQRWEPNPTSGTWLAPDFVGLEIFQCRERTWKKRCSQGWGFSLSRRSCRSHEVPSNDVDIR